MRYTFKTDARVPERVVIDRTLLTGKLKVYIDGKQVGPSHQGRRGAAGTFYPVKSGTLEVRSSYIELVPSVWYNENWVDLVPPMQVWQYLLVVLPLIGAVVITFGQLVGLVVGALGMLLSYVVMRSQRPTNVRLAIGLVIAVLAPVVSVVTFVVLNNLVSAK